MAGAQGSQGRVVGKDFSGDAQDQVTQDLTAAAVRAEPGMITHLVASGGRRTSGDRGGAG